VTWDEAVIENMRFTLSAMCSLETSRSRVFTELDKLGFALATGTNAASENWAFLPSHVVTRETVEQICSFFGGLELPFVWPVFPGTETSCRQTLEAEGLFSRGELVAMLCAKPPREEIERRAISTSWTFEVITTDEGAILWAQTAWRGFDSPSEAPVSFVELARGLAKKDGFLPLLVRKADIPVGTAMLSLSDASVGVYYFATLPEERRKGAARAMMNEIFRLTWERPRKSRDIITLQATPSGVPFYAAQGFEPLFEISLYSRSEEVF
jgi:GNAT superfamily N-acetyltransferase